ncbi:MAG: endoribonuclease MazF [Chloroflexi bacterium]|nr:endoribonuclease MazF [Chloroflexota bacterium]
MVDADYIPARGDIIWLNFTPQAGHEQAGHRPALVVSPRVYNERSNVILVCPITSRRRDGPFEVALPAGGSFEGVVLADQIRSQDWRARGASFAAQAPRAVMGDVLAKVQLLVE